MRVSQHTETNMVMRSTSSRVFGRKPPVTTRRVYHAAERAPEGTRSVLSESNPVSDREEEQAVSLQSTASASAPTVTAQTQPVKRPRLEGKQHIENHESPATLPNHPMDLSDAPARVRLNMKRSPLESHDGRPKQRRVLEDPDGDEVMIGYIHHRDSGRTLWRRQRKILDSNPARSTILQVETKIPCKRKRFSRPNWRHNLKPWVEHLHEQNFENTLQTSSLYIDQSLKKWTWRSAVPSAHLVSM